MYKRPLSDIHYIIVHHTVTPETFAVEDILRIHLGQGYSDVGYHFLVTGDGLKTGRPAVYAGAHALSEKLSKEEGYMNRHGLGLAIIGSFMTRPPAKKLINETAYAIKQIARKYRVPLDRKHILGHHDVDYTACPGKDTMKLIYRKLGI